MAHLVIEISDNGPLLIKEAARIIDKKTGREIQVQKFPAALCRCGQSQNKPFCDGSHARGFDGHLAAENLK